MFGRIMHLKSILVNMLVWSQKAEQYLYIDQNYLLFIKMWPQKGFLPTRCRFLCIHSMMSSPGNKGSDKKKEIFNGICH